MYTAIIEALAHKPALYEPSDGPFWDDPHISSKMLEAHLHPTWDAASRNHAFMDRSAKWIAEMCGGAQGSALLDLGCGPGLYAERFTRNGFRVTGVDLSHRSIEYARESARKQGLSIAYERANYTEIDSPGVFRAVTLIYCDYGVLSPEDRQRVLRLARRSLSPGGLFFVDCIGPGRRAEQRDESAATYENGGFWTAEPHALLTRSIFYPDTDNTLDRYIVITDTGVRVYNTWNQIFSAETLSAELRAAGFSGIQFFGDVAGAPFREDGDVICAVAMAE